VTKIVFRNFDQNYWQLICGTAITYSWSSTTAQTNWPTRLANCAAKKSCMRSNVRAPVSNRYFQFAPNTTRRLSPGLRSFTEAKEQSRSWWRAKAPSSIGPSGGWRARAKLNQKWSLTPVLSAPSVVMSHWPQPKLSRTSPTQRPSSGPDPRENSGVEIPSHLTVVSDDSSGPNTYGGQAAGRKTDSAQVTHHRSRSASTGSSSAACSEQAQKEYFYVHPNRRTNHQARQK
jgi:hypothetical protein